MKTDYNKLKKEFLDYLKKERGFSDYTIKSYNIDIKIFFDFCRKLDFNFGDYYNYNIGENNESKFDIWEEQNSGCNGQYEFGSENFDDCKIFSFYNNLSTSSIYQTEGDFQSSGEEHYIEWTKI